MIILVISPLNAQVIIIGDENLAPVFEAMEGIQETLGSKAIVYSPNQPFDIKKAELVIALGNEAAVRAQKLPESIPVVIGLVIDQSQITRKNTTGVYMATPPQEYLSILNIYFPQIKKVGVVYGETREAYSPMIVPYSASNPYELLNSIISSKGSVDSILLLPEKNLISARTIEEVYLYSFREKVPILGISEKHVKMGSLFAYVFDEKSMGEQLGRVAGSVIESGNAYDLKPAPPDKFNIFINTGTAKSMGIKIPNELLKKAKRIYQ